MKIAEIINRMEKATSFMNETRVVVKEIHDAMGVIKPIAEEAGLEFHIWDITIPDGYGRHTTVIRYGTNITEDKRYKKDRVGKLHHMTFEPGQDYISLDDTVEEAINKVKLTNANNNLKRLQDELEGLYKQTEQYKRYIQDVKAEIVELMK